MTRRCYLDLIRSPLLFAAGVLAGVALVMAAVWNFWPQIFGVIS